MTWLPPAFALLSEPTGETIRRFNQFALSRICPGSKGAHLFRRNFSKSAKILELKVEDEENFADRILFAKHGQVGKSVELAKEILRGAISRRREEITLEFAERVFRKTNSTMGMTPFEAAGWSAVEAELLSIGWAQ
ncbi:hypothetical protein [Thalassorhabdomicrobium marinisediminis]|uniref:Uncharacterized protein n=1 Tax=Thalassorhabdomicrobium marinisediminis TaxID=2170577 RepID=A0A2T7FVP6_9RHOB|nr:hypothetical protein [Thalassorhabdomicrobium marinisediminis]PVA06209.1 hypothetical protein DC363_09850 [Thalassorhabdomicrobium marinisediminis]